jgi:hypothetical protein
MVTQVENQSISQNLLEFINRNPVVYGLYFKGYENGKIVYSDPSQFAIRDAVRDMELFNQRQEAINNRNKISEGDWIIRKDGKYEGISVAYDGWTQAGGAGSVYVSKNGYCSYSGSCGDFIESFEATEETKERVCWIFSNDSAGAHRGVYHKLNFKVWKEL